MEKASPPPYSPSNAYPQAGYNPQPGFNPPPAQGYAPPPNQPQANVVMVLTAPVAFGPNAQTLNCPHCHHQVRTRVVTEAGSKTHLFAFLLCFFGCFPCCLIPYCMDSCQNRNHYCPSCGAYLGVYTD